VPHPIKSLSPLLFLVAACASGGAMRTPVEVQVWGSLPGMHKRGEIEALVHLDTLLPAEHAVGLGARAGLLGEITVTEGAAFVARSNGSRDVVHAAERAADDGACLLVWAEVPRWRTVTVEHAVPMARLGEFLAEKVGHAGPTPFRILGRFTELDWHVVDGPTAPGIEASCEAHSAAGVQSQAEGGVEAELVGFWSTRHKAVFTRHDSLHHTHVVVRGGEPRSGHVDGGVIPAGSALLLPE
jgi:acetolactate decarboxylase